MSQENYNEKPSAFKNFVQLTGAFCAVACADAPQRGYEAFGNAYDYVKTYAALKLNPPKPNGA